MTDQNINLLRRIRRALLSVSDKTGLVDFARALRRFDIELLSTGGTAKTLREAGLEVRDVSDVTGFPEMLDGRVKTLHPNIHGALLAMRDDASHMAALREHGIEPIDMVVINLYPFEQTVAREGVTLEEAIEQIDIGGPAIIRSAAKNWRDVAVVAAPDSYATITDEMQHHNGALSLATRGKLAGQAFQRTSAYDAAICAYLTSSLAKDKAIVEEEFAIPEEHEPAPDSPAVQNPSTLFPHDDQLDFSLRKVVDLRYGENPHQAAALYSTGTASSIGGVAHAELLSGKEMSYNNYVDADAAWQLVCDFDEMGCAIIKHTNPAGVGLGSSNEEAYRRALATDPVSAFGGVVAFNRTVDEAVARAVTEIFTEVVIAPDYDPPAVEVLRSKKNLRVLRVNSPQGTKLLEARSITGGMLIQTPDTHRPKRDDLRIVTRRAPSENEIASLLFAWAVCKHTKSNAIVYARDGQTIGVGAGQMSRIDSVRIGAMRAHLPVEGSVLASDAFFPFRDGVDEAAHHGITAIIQPGGSVRDNEVTAAADEHNLAMVFTGVRHFKH